MASITYRHTASGEVEFVASRNAAQRYPWHLHAAHWVSGVVLSGGLVLETRAEARYLRTGGYFRIPRRAPTGCFSNPEQPCWRPACRRIPPSPRMTPGLPGWYAKPARLSLWAREQSTWADISSTRNRRKKALRNHQYKACAACCWTTPPRPGPSSGWPPWRVTAPGIFSVVSAGRPA